MDGFETESHGSRTVKGEKLQLCTSRAVAS